MSGGSPGTSTPMPAAPQDLLEDCYLTPTPGGHPPQIIQAPASEQCESMSTSPFSQSQPLPATFVAPGPAIDNDEDIFGPEEQIVDDDYSPPFSIYVAYRTEEQVTESLPVFATSLSTMAAFLTEPTVAERLRNLAKDSGTFDSTIMPMFNNLRSLVNQWNNILDNDVRVQRPVNTPVRPKTAASAPISNLDVVRPTHALGTTHRPLGVGGVPKSHTVQMTLPFKTTVTAAPPPIPTSTRPPTTYAQAVKTRPPNAVMDVAKMLVSAMPDAPAAAVFDMAARMAPKPTNNRATPRHAPRDASKVITVRPVEGTNVIVSQIPNDQALLSNFSVAYEEAKIDGRIPQEAPDVMYVRWINHSLHIQFRTAPIDGTENIVESFWAGCPGLCNALPATSKFRFRNGILYRRVPFSDPANANSLESVQYLKATILSQPAWEGITLIGNPRVQITSGSTYGNVFVDFHDNSTSKCMRQVMRQVIYLNGATCRATQAHNFRPATPRCAICQRWGHSSQICRSPVVRCPICTLAHDERDHERIAAQAPVKCYNCNDSHRADSITCPFFQHRRDRDWIQSHPPASQPTQSIPHLDLRQTSRVRRTTRIGMGRQQTSK